ncbi:hypothetical protein [Nocardia testacea]|uniref:hypothetical protein n=1 Tax=Nocardia testacea TaxID=248551 RepID=UPI0002D83C02|nr:hypothetical protein [Nocardia testacea]
MNGQQNGQEPSRYAVTHYDRVRGNYAFQSMAGPEFTGTSSVFAPVRALPIGVQLIVWAVLILVGMCGCTAAWIDQQSYQPSPNVCRVDQAPYAEQLGCVRPAPQVQSPVGRP